MIKNVTLKISNANSCKQCMHVVNYSVKGLPGITSITITAEKDRFEADIFYESGTVSFEKIRNTIVELGYIIDGYIIHEHPHSHGEISHNHPHTHEEKEIEHSHSHSEPE